MVSTAALQRVELQCSLGFAQPHTDLLDPAASTARTGRNGFVYSGASTSVLCEINQKQIRARGSRTRQSFQLAVPHRRKFPIRLNA